MNKAVVINAGKILDIVNIDECKGMYNATELISAEEHIVMPGFINTHTHLPMVYFKGIADDLPLDIWLRDYIWPVESKCINPDFIFEASLHGVSELIKNGITFFNDMYFIPLETAKACKQLGMRAVLCNAILDFSINDYDKSETCFDKLYECIEMTKDNPLIEISQSLHSVYTCTLETWKRAIEIARKENILIHTHLCETIKEVEECKLKYKGMSPIKLLDSINAFDERLIFAHGIYLDEEDFNILKCKNSSVSMNIHSNLK
jgi:5-methylthioadenosine/S-adenosylhomocysteine deaminase